MKYIDAEKLKQPDKKEVLLVPVEVIPEQMSIEQFLDAWRKEEPAVLKIIETKCGKVILEPEEQPKVDLADEIRRFLSNATKMNKGEWRGKYPISDVGFRAVARHFYGLRNRALEEAARHVYESWMGGTMDDVRRDMVELGKVLNARKEE